MRQDGVVDWDRSQVKALPGKAIKRRLMPMKFSKLSGELEVTKQTLIWPNVEGEGSVGGGLRPDFYSEHNSIVLAIQGGLGGVEATLHGPVSTSVL